MATLDQTDRRTQQHLGFVAKGSAAKEPANVLLVRAQAIYCFLRESGHSSGPWFLNEKSPVSRASITARCAASSSVSAAYMPRSKIAFDLDSQEIDDCPLTRFFGRLDNKLRDFRRGMLSDEDNDLSRCIMREYCQSVRAYSFRPPPR